MENKKEVVLRKIPLKLVIEILTDLWNRGADYVDIIGTMDKVQDSIGISFCSDYMNEDMKENFDKISAPTVETEEKTISPFDENDLNQLI